MTAGTLLQEIEKYIPVVGDINIKSPLAYQATRGVAADVVKLTVGYHGSCRGLYQL